MTQDPAQPGEGDTSAAGASTVADLGTRLGAKVIDYIILAVVYFVLLVPIFITAVLGGAAFGGLSGFSGTGLVASIVSIAIFLAYFVLMESMTGQTLGKMLLKVSVQGKDGGNPTFEEALKRNGWMILGIVPVLGSLATLAAAIFILVTINNSATRQGWHDEFAGGTAVVKAG